jgi:putative transposase
MVADPALYRWSSYRANALGEADTLVTPHALYLGLGDDEEARRAAYPERIPGAFDDRPLSPAIRGCPSTKINSSATTASIGRSRL